MAKGINKSILVGNVANNPSLAHNTHETYLKIIVATNDSSWSEEERKYVEETEYHTVVISGNFAESMNHRVSKGQKVYVEGKHKTLKAKHRKSGLIQRFPQVRADTLLLLGSKPSTQSPNPGDRHQTSPGSANNSLR